MTSNDNRWRKASYSGGEGGNCIEVADQAGQVLVRDSQDRDGVMLRLSASSWQTFTSQIKTS